MSSFEVQETDDVGRTITTYIISSTSSASSRIDILPSTITATQPLTQWLLTLFLPTGYPHTVSHDYTHYQIYDSFQAFFSAIAGLLASRAVLQGLGVGDETATATAAMLLSIAQESIGRLATIFFAHWTAKRIEADCKTYRFLADIVNDCAFVMDCLSPSLPKPVRISLLCAASMCRAVCGVAGGSSKAVLSAHFARANNIGELNAKDSSQETVISLLGMWAGGYLVSHVRDTKATWIWLLMLLAMHLTTNYWAVRSICLLTLNRQRANIVFSNWGTGVPSPAAVSQQEVIFEADGILKFQGHQVGFGKIGSFDCLLRAIGTQVNAQTGSIRSDSISLDKLLDAFQNEEYVLWFEPETTQVTVVLKTGATAKTEIFAWDHALNLANAFHLSRHSEKATALEVLDAIIDTIKPAVERERQINLLQQSGWDVASCLFQTEASSRIRAMRQKSEPGKNQSVFE